LIALAGLALAGCVLVSLPPVRERIALRFEALRAKIFYSLNPPEEAVFTPQQNQEVDVIVQSTMQAYQLTATASAAPTDTPTFIPQADVVTVTPFPTLAPLPASATLSGVRYEDQHGLWNYCAPATLSMALSFWGWQGNRVTAGEVLKPYEKDKNVMLYEMESFAAAQPGLTAVLRPGGTLEQLKRLIAAGFPPIIEKGTYIKEVSTGRISWMGHYNVLTGYDDAAGQFIAQDSYYTADYPLAYNLLEREWRAFNFMFLVIYPPERQDELFAVLGAYQDLPASNRLAAGTAQKEAGALQGVDRYFAQFNYGTNLVNQQNYGAAASAYDRAFELYAALPAEERPWRILWYQTGPYFAYYYMGRYQDVIELATTTLDAASEPFLEESYYWRARARAALGDMTGAAEDLHTSLKYHPDFGPTLQAMQDLGITN